MLTAIVEALHVPADIVPESAIPPPNVAAPASDISNVRAVITPPPSESFPLNIMSLSAVSDLIMKSELALLKLPKDVPPSLRIISVSSQSRMISPAESIVKSPDSVPILELIIPFFTLNSFAMLGSLSL